MKTIRWLLLACMLAAGAAMAETPRYHLVISVSEDSVDKLRLALNTAKHTQDTLGRDNVVIEIVTFGPGINTLRYYTPLDDALKEMYARGVRIVVCEAGMRSAKLRAADMIQKINLSYVPSGMAEITVRQAEGWSYAAP